MRAESAIYLSISPPRRAEAFADVPPSGMSVPRLVTAAQPRLYLNMDADGTMDLTGAGHAPAASTSLAGGGVVQPLHTSRKGKKEQKPDTAGAAWGHMAAKELTPELKRDLQIIRMRGVLDPKRFYRSSDIKKELPKYFQVGTLIGGVDDAGAKKKPKGSMLQDVMGDAKIRKRTKAQFGKIQAVKALSARPRKGERGAGRTSKGKKKR